MARNKRILAKICSGGSTIFDYLSLFVLADNFFSLPVLAFSLFFALCYLYLRRNAELVEQRAVNKPLSPWSEVFPHIVMCLIAGTIGNVPLAKGLFMVVMLAGKEIWEPIARNREIKKLEKKKWKTKAEMERLGILRRKMMYPGGRD